MLFGENQELKPQVPDLRSKTSPGNVLFSPLPVIQGKVAPIVPTASFNGQRCQEQVCCESSRSVIWNKAQHSFQGMSNKSHSENIFLSANSEGTESFLPGNGDAGIWSPAKNGPRCYWYHHASNKQLIYMESCRYYSGYGFIPSIYGPWTDPRFSTWVLMASLWNWERLHHVSLAFSQFSDQYIWSPYCECQWSTHFLPLFPLTKVKCTVGHLAVPKCQCHIGTQNRSFLLATKTLPPQVSLNTKFLKFLCAFGHYSPLGSGNAV